MTDEHSGLSDLQRQVDHAHQTTERAELPPPGLWRHIRAQAQPITEKKETQTMISPAAVYATPTAPVHLKGANRSHRFGHYANLTATIALVLAVAVGGWFAMLQLQPGDPNPRLAALQGTPGAADAQACDVEPLTVDEVMEIVRNPYRYLSDRGDAGSALKADLALATEPELMEGLLSPEHNEFESANRSRPNQAQFDEARSAVDRYIACLPSATYGHLWAMIDPMWVQQHVLGNFPVFAEEIAVRTFIEEKIDQRIDSNFNVTFTPFYTAYDWPTITANPNTQMAAIVSASTGDYQPLVAVGVLVTGADGQVIMETDSSGFPHQIRDGAVPQRPVVVVGKSTTTGQWYVLPWLGN